MKHEKIKEIELWYPRVRREDREEDQPTKIRIGLMDVRAANDILVEYDFERDGYRILANTIFEWEVGDDQYDEGWEEVAFIPAWHKEQEK